MSSSDSAIAVLRGATQAAHHRLEQTLGVTHPDAGLTEYVSYASALLGWLAPFEHKLWSSAWPEGLNEARREGKCAWLEEDLKRVGMESATVPRCSFSPALDGLPSRIGLAYVIEGAQLGTRVLARTLGPKLNGWAPRWLQGYGDESAKNWREFLAFTETHLHSEADRRTAAIAATAAFASLATWFTQCTLGCGNGAVSRAHASNRSTRRRNLTRTIPEPLPP